MTPWPPPVCSHSARDPRPCQSSAGCFSLEFRIFCVVARARGGRGGGGGWHEAMALVCLPLAAPIGLSPLLILTPCGPKRVLVVSTEPPDDLSCLTTPGVGRLKDGAPCR